MDFAAEVHAADLHSQDSAETSAKLATRSFGGYQYDVSNQVRWRYFCELAISQSTPLQEPAHLCEDVPVIITPELCFCPQFICSGRAGR